jgi:hypothetical protein
MSGAIGNAVMGRDWSSQSRSPGIAHSIPVARGELRPHGLLWLRDDRRLLVGEEPFVS